MIILLKSIGDLRDYFGREPQQIELPDKATVQDLLSTIDTRWGAVLPRYIWDSDVKRFRGPVVLLINKEMVRDVDTPLNDGLEVHIMKALMGG